MSSKLESDVCCHLQVAPSGESYEGKRRPGRKQWQSVWSPVAIQMAQVPEVQVQIQVKTRISGKFQELPERRQL